MKDKRTYDYYLIWATAVVLFAISILCIAAMFYFKVTAVQLMAPAQKAAYMSGMNTLMAPFLIALILLLGICVPKRVFPPQWLNRFAGFLVLTAVVISLLNNIKMGLLVVLIASLALQIIVLIMAIAGSKKLHFERKGYWVRIGSSLIHLALILFVLDLFLHKHQTLHLLLFWTTTSAMVIGMIFCFYADTVVYLAKKIGLNNFKSSVPNDDCRR